MPLTPKSILAKIWLISKRRQIACPHCGEKKRFIKYGRYRRYGKQKKKIFVQRFQCQNSKCPKGPRYFSCLPFPLLPFLGISFFFLLRITLSRAKDSWKNLEKRFSSNRSSLQRWLKLANRIFVWLKDTNFLDEPALSWNLLIHLYSRAFYSRFHA